MVSQRRIVSGQAGVEEVILRNGQSLRVRPIRPDDKKRLEEFFYGLSPRTRYLRFQHAKAYISQEELKYYTEVTPPERCAYVATVGLGDEERIVAVGRYDQTPDDERTAELAFVVADNVQVRGIGTALLERLADTATGYRMKRFVAQVLPENTTMLDVFDQSGFKVEKRLEDGIFHYTLDLEQQEEYAERQSHREHVARSAGARLVLYPRTVAVIGASRNPESVGGAVFLNLLRSGFQGTVFPVNPKAASIAGVMAYPSVMDVPGDVDLAVIVVPAEYVLDVVDRCGKKGVQGLVIISAGFGETGEEGRERQRQLKEKALSHGMRLVGPNCLGVLNLDPKIRLNATFAPVLPEAGNVSIASQSGALGLALLDHAKSIGLGLAQFVSIGNRVDISSNDLLEFWEDDENTDVILLYEESFGNPRKFSRIARRVSRKKPIIVVKAGRSAVGARAASSHTGALAAADVAVDAMFRQAGVIRVDTIAEMFNVAETLAYQPSPKGPRVGILTNAGGPGVLAADAAEGWGLVVPTLSKETQDKLRGFLPAAAAVANPVDMIASAPPEAFKKSLQAVLEDPGIDSVIVIYIPPLVTKPEEVAAAIREAMAGYQGDKPVLACFMMSHGGDINLTIDSGRRLPTFAFPEEAVQALARAYRYSQYRSREEGRVPRFRDIDGEKARSYVLSSVALNRDGTWLLPEVVSGLLKYYGIPSVDTRLAMTADGAVRQAKEIGFPVVMKVRSSTIVHKTDVGGIALGLSTEDEVTRAFEDISSNVQAAGRKKEMEGVVIQPMLPRGQEVIVGMSQDPTFGPLVMVGLGGVQVELIKDVAFSLHPLRDVDPDRMLGQLKSLPLLQGWRGARPKDVKALKELLLRFSLLIEDFPEIDQMEMNPVIVFDEGKGCAAVDARVFLKLPAEPEIALPTWTAAPRRARHS